MDRVEIWEEEGGAGEEGLWVKIAGIEGGGDAFVNMVYWPGEVIGKGENLAMVVGNVAEKVDRYRGMGLVVTYAWGGLR